ncbi:MAG: WD40/YVTN/BNR-like repeat-containing protein [Nitrososphaerota archaeon]
MEGTQHVGMVHRGGETVRRSRAFRLAIILWSTLLLVGIIAGCATAPGTSSPPTGAYGGSLNHLHDLLPLRGFDGTVLVATHLGLYRTTDRGQSWREVAGGPGQTMDSLMIFKLAQSPVDPHRIYALAAQRTSTPPPAVPGVYTSADAGQTWQLAASFASFATLNAYTISAGAKTADTAYVFLPSRGSNGLMMSNDAGKHWQTQPALPVSDITGLAVDPGHPGRMFVWSPASGLYESTDQGASWNAVSSVQGGVYGLSFAGNQIYVQSDSGMFVSDATGTRFHPAASAANFSSASFCAASPSQGYGLTGTGVERTTDGGKTWQAAASLTGHPGLIAADPVDARIAYVGFSYPVGLEITTDGGQHWRSVMAAS